MSKHQDGWLNAKVRQTILAPCEGWLLDFWMFSARSCPSKSLEPRPQMHLTSAFWSHSMNSWLVLRKHSDTDPQRSWLGDGVVASFLWQCSGTMVSPLPAVVHRQIREVSKCACTLCGGNLPTTQTSGAPHVSVTPCMWTKERTVFQIYSVWVEVSDKGTWRTGTRWGFLIRSLNSRRHSKCHLFLTIWCSPSFFQKLQCSLHSLPGCKTAFQQSEVVFPTPEPSCEHGAWAKPEGGSGGRWLAAEWSHLKKWFTGLGVQQVNEINSPWVASIPQEVFALLEAVQILPGL